MMKNRVDQQFSQIDTALLEMGALAEHQIALAGDALLYQDLGKAKQCIDSKSEARQKEREIEAMCLKLLLQHPLARDLRTVSSALKMITDIERICDQSGDIAEIAVYLVDRPTIKKLDHLPQMAAACIRMLNTGLDALVEDDWEKARSVTQMDDTVDRLFDIIKYELISLIREDADNGEQAIDLLMIAKYFERIGDHAQNIAEWVEYIITGVHQREELQ